MQRPHSHKPTPTPTPHSTLFSLLLAVVVLQTNFKFFYFHCCPITRSLPNREYKVTVKLTGSTVYTYIQEKIRDCFVCESTLPLHHTEESLLLWTSPAMWTASLYGPCLYCVCVWAGCSTTKHKELPQQRDTCRPTEINKLTQFNKIRCMPYSCLNHNLRDLN